MSNIRDTALLPFAQEAATGDPSQLAPLTLAYMGDCVYDLYVRTLLVNMSTATVHKLHLMSAGLVCARAQARACERVLPMLNEKEAAVYKRGRNTHMGTIAKNANIADYRAATGLEAVIGYVYLLGDDERLNALMRVALNELPDIIKGEISSITREKENDKL